MFAIRRACQAEIDRLRHDMQVQKDREKYHEAHQKEMHKPTGRYVSGGEAFDKALKDELQRDKDKKDKKTGKFDKAAGIAPELGGEHSEASNERSF